MRWFVGCSGIGLAHLRRRNPRESRRGKEEWWSRQSADVKLSICILRLCYNSISDRTTTSEQSIMINVAEWILSPSYPIPHCCTSSQHDVNGDGSEIAPFYLLTMFCNCSPNVSTLVSVVARLTRGEGGNKRVCFLCKKYPFRTQNGQGVIKAVLGVHPITHVPIRQPQARLAQW